MANINKIKLSGTTYNIQDLNATKTVELTQAEYDALSPKDPNTFYIITDATAGDLSNYYTKTETDGLLDTKLDVTAYTPTDLSNYYTKAETSGATEISTALSSKADTATTYTKTETDNAITAATSTKQDTLVSGTNIKTINNQSILGEGNITIEGGGSITIDQSLDSSSTNPVANSAITNAINEKQNKLTASDGIRINEYQNTIFLDVPIYKAKDFRSCFVGNNPNSPNIVSGQYSFAVGLNNNVTGNYSLAVGGLDSYGEGNSATTINTFAFGRGNIAKSFCSTVVGYHNSSSNEYETDFGIYNNSISASTTFGDSGNTLFSVGNGTSESARHNAFEIRQNGDIYITKDGQDVKLQDQLVGGGSSYTAGDGIDITNDVISVTGKVDTSTYETYTAATDTALASKQTTLTAGTGISIVDNVISATGGGGGVNVVQTTGTSTTDVMSQNAVTTKLKTKLDVVRVEPKTPTSNYTQLNLYLEKDGGGSQSLFTYIKTINGKSITSQNNKNLEGFSLVDTSAITTSVTSSSTDAQVPSAKAVYDQLGGLKLVKLTQNEYDSLTTKDNSTLYVIVN